MKWRTENKIGAILDQGLDPDLKEKFPYFIDGVDKRGRPIVTLPYGDWDVRSFVEAEGPERFVRYTNQYLENVSIDIRRSTKEVENGGGEENPCIQFVMISDLTGYTYRQLGNLKAVQSLIQMVSVFEAHYPETMAECIVINAPAIFSILFGMLKPFMSRRTVEKFQMFPVDKEKWEPVIHELIDPSQIRQPFGGTRE
jgi:hypothetical protein